MPRSGNVTISRRFAPAEPTTDARSATASAGRRPAQLLSPDRGFRRGEDRNHVDYRPREQTSAHDHGRNMFGAGGPWETIWQGWGRQPPYTTTSLCTTIAPALEMAGEHLPLHRRALRRCSARVRRRGRQRRPDRRRERSSSSICAPGDRRAPPGIGRCSSARERLLDNLATGSTATGCPSWSAHRTSRTRAVRR